MDKLAQAKTLQIAFPAAGKQAVLLDLFRRRFARGDERHEPRAITGAELNASVFRRRCSCSMLTKQ